MGILDSNIKNNLFRQAGAVGASKASSAITSSLKKNLFEKLGENNLFSARGFLGGITTRLLREVLFTRKGATGHFDPVWKLSHSKIAAADSSGVVGSLLKAVSDDFAGSGRPKTKFNFTVQIEYGDLLKANLPYSDDGNKNIASQFTISPATANDDGVLEEVVVHSAPSPLIGAKGMGGENGIELALKQATRPQPTVTYQDVNFYNYRTKIATKVDFGTMTITFYDDIRNRAHDIFDLYLKNISPIANIPGNVNASSLGIHALNNDDTFNPSSLGALSETDNEGLIRSITINHYLPIDYSKFSGFTDFAEGTKLPFTIVQYVFLNPKIVNMALDDLDMSQNDTSAVTLTFVYDSVFINKEEGTMDAVSGTAVPNKSNRFIGAIQNTIDNITGGITGGVNGVVSGIAGTATQATSALANKVNADTLLTKAKSFING